MARWHGGGTKQKRGCLHRRRQQRLRHSSLWTQDRTVSSPSNQDRALSRTRNYLIVLNTKQPSAWGICGEWRTTTALRSARKDFAFISHALYCKICRFSSGISRNEPMNGISGISLRAAVIAHGGACRAPSHHSLPHFAPICPLQACVLFSSNLRQPSSALVSPSSICQLYFGLRRPASDRAKTCRQHTISRALDRNLRARYRGMPKLQSRDPLFVMDAHCQEY